MLLLTAISLFVFINFFYSISIFKRDMSVVDIAWGLGFVVIAAVNYINSQISLKNTMIVLAVCVWGLRLSTYFLYRSLGKPEDFRYAKLRTDWGRSVLLQSYFKVFILQSAIMIVIASPVIMAINSYRENLSILNIFGLFVWLVGFCIEVYADSYLIDFKKNPKNKGQLCQTGPWKICRFPNYLGEIVLWYGIYFMCFSVQNSWTIIGPLTIHFFLLKVSGIPLLEQRLSKKDGYAEYSKKVPRILPF